MTNYIKIIHFEKQNKNNNKLFSSVNTVTFNFYSENQIEK